MVPSHISIGQLTVAAGGTQLPPPSHRLAGVKVESSLEQEAAAQTVDGP